MSGFAEVIKHGFIADREYLNQLKNITPETITPELIYHSIEIKNHVVTTDPYEKGLRKTLNFGHTIGHAIESYSLQNDKNPLLHGEAIAAGMICEGFLSNKYNTLDENGLNELIEIIRSVFPDYAFSKETYPAIIDFMKNDKKNTSGKIGFALLKELGVCDYNNYIEEDKIIESLDFYNNLIK